MSGDKITNLSTNALEPTAMEKDMVKNMFTPCRSLRNLFITIITFVVLSVPIVNQFLLKHTKNEILVIIIKVSIFSVIILFFER